MGTNCASLVADLFLFVMRYPLCCLCQKNNQTDIIEAFNSTSRYLDDLLNIDNPYFEQMVGQIYPTEKIVSEYDQEKPQSQTADNPMAPRGRAAQPSQDTRKTN